MKSRGVTGMIGLFISITAIIVSIFIPEIRTVLITNNIISHKEVLYENEDIKTRSEANGFPIPTNWVSDYGKIYSPVEEDHLNKSIHKYRMSSNGNEIAILTVNDISPYTSLREFSVDLFSTWGLGQKVENNGLLIVILPSRRQIRITTGTRTENYLSDAFLDKLIENEIVPAFKEKRYYEGTINTLNRIITKWGN